MNTYTSLSNSAINDEVHELAKSLLACAAPCKHPLLVKKKLSKKRSRHVYKLDIGNTTYYFKMYSNHSLLKHLQDATRGSRANRAYKISIKLENKGFNIASPVAAFTNKLHLANKRSIFVTRELIGKDFLHNFLEGSPALEQEKNKALLLALYKRLIDHKIYHRDLNLTNCRRIDDKLYLLDVDDVRGVWFFHPLNLLSNLERHNIALVLLSARYPHSWFGNTDREKILYELASNYIPKPLLAIFLNTIFTKSFKKANKFLSNDQQTASLKKLILEAKKTRQNAPIEKP